MSNRSAMLAAISRMVAGVSAMLLLTSTASAALVGGYTPMRITEVFTYSTFGGGDVMFKTDVIVVGCEGGYWLRATDPGFKVTYAALLAAFSTRSVVRVWAHDDQLWSGSGSKCCRLDALGPLPP
jgi:hypothetical protein